jgi:hypothetical protein
VRRASFSGSYSYVVAAPAASVYEVSCPSVLKTLVIDFVFSPTVVLCLTSAPVSVLYSFVTFGSAVSVAGEDL